jgi:hypothetical protein
MEPKRQQGSVGSEALPFVLKALPRMELGFMPGSKISFNPKHEVIIYANYSPVNNYHIS